MNLIHRNKTKIFALVIILVLALIACSLYFICLKDSSSVDNEILADEDFEVKYNIFVGHKEYKKELHILNDGKYSFTTTNTLTEENSITEGKIDVKLIKDFISYALKKGIRDMGDDMFAEDLYDGADIFLEIRLGNEIIRSGGYSPGDVNANFNLIIEKLNSIIEIG